jgi:dephospho-CoA kinase
MNVVLFDVDFIRTDFLTCLVLLVQIVFSYEEARKKLNKITHPHILWQVTKLLLWHWIKGTKLIILDVPLLFEVKLQKLCNMVVVVYAPVELQLQR